MIHFDDGKIDFRHFVSVDGLRAIQATVTFDGVEATDSAVCSESDNFNKEVGRKLALRRAIRPFPRGSRSQIWRAYHQRNGLNEIRVQ